MINLFFDLDDTIFDFSHDFVNFVNDRMGKKQYCINERPTEYECMAVFGMEPVAFHGWLERYVDAGRFATQPLLLTTFKALTYFAQNPDKYCIPTFITIREPGVVLQTMHRLQDLYSELYKVPTQGFHLFMANSKLHKKWQIIRELSRHNPDGIFVDDCPTYIEDMMIHNPNVISFYMNTLGMTGDVCSHYTVDDWEGLLTIIRGRSYKDILMGSKHPGVQLAIS